MMVYGYFLCLSVKLTIGQSLVQANTSYARGYGISLTRVGQTSTFTILAKDVYGNEPPQGDNSFCCITNAGQVPCSDLWCMRPAGNLVVRATGSTAYSDKQVLL